MKRIFCALVFLLTASLLVHADTADPQMRLDPIGGNAPYACTDPASTNPFPFNQVQAVYATSPFSFSATGTGFYCFVRQDNGAAWKTLDINLTGLSLQFTPSDINCSTDGVYFDYCNTPTDSHGFVTDLVYSGGPGISYQNIFSIDIRPHNVACTPTPTDPFCWGSGDFNATGSPTSTPFVPEPATATLLISGAAALLGLRRRR